MGKFVNVCAGADHRTLPESKIEAMLFNVPHHGSSRRKIENAKELSRRAGSRYIMKDSGGFQLLEAERKSKTISFDPNRPVMHTSREINISPKHVMSVATDFQADIVMGLDWPIIKIEAKYPEARKKEFFRKLKYNVRWAFESSYWLKQLCSPQTKYFQPIQCYNLSQLEVFFDSVTGLEYDGVSMPIRNLKVWEIALFMVKFYQLGIKRVHLLGTSSFFVIAFCAYMARHLFDWVSLDATSWSIAARYREFFNPFDLSRERLKSGVIISHSIKNNCPCPFCTGKSFNKIKDMDSKDKFCLLKNHNWWVLEKSFHDLYKNGYDVIQLERFLRGRSKNPDMVDELCKILSLVDALKDFDIRLLQDLLDTSKKKRKPSASRLKAVPA
jgi:tRNA-guanine family transglycosylase